MIDRLLPELEGVGLSDKEAKVYLAALELGQSTAQVIAAKATVQRPTTYIAIESLVQKGLMSSIVKGKKKYFVAEAPDRIHSMIQQQEHELREKEKRVRKIMDDLKVLAMAAKDRPAVSFFEGHRGVETMRDNLRQSHFREVEEFCRIDLAYKHWPPSPNDHRGYFRKNYNIRFIYASASGIILPGRQGNVIQRRISLEEYPFEGDITVCGNIVSILSYTPSLIGVQVYHDAMAGTLRQIFNLAWKYLEKKDPSHDVRASASAVEAVGARS
jgi:predicted transcriptional regulator